MKETKVYIDELPSSCDECPIEHCGEYCTLNGVEIDTWSYSDKRPKDCPLIDIKTHDRELVRQVCEKIRIKVDNISMHTATKERLMIMCEEIQQEFEDENNKN